METAQHDPVTTALASVAETNMAEAWRAIGRAPQSELYAGPDMLRIITGIPHPAMNGVLQAQLAPDAIDAQIDAALSPFTARGMPMLWWIGPATRPHDLGARLQAHGLAHAEELPGMALDLAALIEDVPAPPDLAIEEVADEGALMHWSRVVATCFEFGQELAGTVCALFAGIGFGEGSSFRHYIGVWRGEPVATSSLFLGTESAGIYCVATLLDARRQGIGAALTLAALREAGAQGYRTAILQASAMGHGVYERLGFRDCCTYSLYHWPGAGEQPGSAGAP